MTGPTEVKSILADLVAPEILYCGFQRMSPVPHDQFYQRQASIAAATEITITVSINDGERSTFNMPIHKQADIQTLARTIEALLTDRVLVVACLVDLGSDNILRWSDTVEDVLDADSIVGVIPLSEQTLQRTTQRARPTSMAETETSAASDASRPTTSPIPQMEFIQISPKLSRADSHHSKLQSIETENSRPSSRRKVSDRSSTKALKALKANARVGSELTIHPPTAELYAETWLPPLPTSPIPKAVQTRLGQICSNAFLLLNFSRYCARKKTLCELLYWLDTNHKINEDYVGRMYLDRDSPLKLNLPREVSTVLEARELLRDGALAWSETGFEVSQEALAAKMIEIEDPILFRSALLQFNPPSFGPRKLFVDTLTTMLDPTNPSLPPIKERQAPAVRQVLLQQVCNQYFAGGQVSTTAYFDLTEAQKTRAQRSKVNNENKALPQAPTSEKATNSSPAQSFTTAGSQTLAESKAEEPATIPALHATINPSTTSTTPRPETPSTAASTIELVREPLSDRYANGLPIQSNAHRKAQKLSSLLGHDVGPDGVVHTTIPAPVRKTRHTRAISTTSSTLSDDMPQFDMKRVDTIRRNSKLRAMLGASSQDIQQAQRPPEDEYEAYQKRRERSPTPSIRSHMSGQSKYSHLSSHMSRAEKDEASDRRAQARKAAKLYAMYGSEQEPRLRKYKSFGDFDPQMRPGSSASNYSTMSSYSRNPTGLSNARYQPNRAPQRQQKTFGGIFGKSTRRTSEATVDSDTMSLNDKAERVNGQPEIRQASPSPKLKDGIPRRFMIEDDEDDPPARTPSAMSFRHSTRDRDELEFLEEDDEEDDEEGEAIVQDVRTNMKLRQLLGNDAPTSSSNT